MAKKNAPTKKTAPTGKKKLSRKEKKALYKKQCQREQELAEAGEIPRRVKYAPRGVFWRMLALCLAFFLGIFVALGGIVGAVVFVGTTQSVRTLASLVPGMEELVTTYLKENYYDMKAFDLYNSIIHDLSDSPITNLDVIDKYTPVLQQYLDQVDDILDPYGVKLDWATIKKTNFSDLGSYLQTTVLPGMEIGPLLNLDEEVTLESIENQPQYYALCYGKYGVDYELDTAAKTISMKEGKHPTTVGDVFPSLSGDEEAPGLLEFLGKYELGSFLGLDLPSKTETRADSAFTYALCYGTEGVDYEVGSDGLVHVLKPESVLTVSSILDQSSELTKKIRLGDVMGLNTPENVAERTTNNALMFALCYGTEGVDYEVGSDGLIHPFDGHDPTSIDDLVHGANDVINGLPLGEMLGINTPEKVADRQEGNALMFTLCYGTEGVDYEVGEDGRVSMKEGKTPTTVGDLINNSSSLIEGMEVSALLGIDANSESVMRYVAFGSELERDEAGEYRTDEEGNWLVVPVSEEEPDGEQQYAGGGKYVIVETENSDGSRSKSIQMLPDPNTGELYAKRTVGDLTKEDADLLGGMRIGDLMDIDASSSGIMQAMKNWTISDLSDQSKIESLTIGDVLLIEEGEDGAKPEGVSGIMWALRDKSIGDLQKQETIDGLRLSDILDIKEDSSGIMKALRDKSISDLQKQETIDNLRLSDILDIKEDSSGIMKAMQDWHVSDLSDQNRINRLKIGQIVSADDSASSLIKAIEGWRISDLTKQEKIDSLTLGDVLDVSEGPRLLQTLGKKRLGELSSAIDTLRLSDMMEEEDLMGNKFLKHLAGSSISTLADDVSALTIRELFGEELYLYLEGGPDAYENAIKAYDPNKPFKSDSGGDDNHPPVPLMKPKGDDMLVSISGEDVTAYRYVGEKGVTGNWYELQDGEPLFSAIHSESEVYRKKADGETVFYVEKRIPVEADIAYRIFDYTTGDVREFNEKEQFGALQEGFTPVPVEGTAVPETYYMAESEEGKFAYPLLKDSYDSFYCIVDGERVDFDEVVTFQNAEGKTVYHDEEGYYYTEEATVCLRYASVDAPSQLYEESETTERFFLKDGVIEGKDSSVEVDRYLAGIWVFLCGEIEYEMEEGVENTDKIAGVKDLTDRPVLDIHASITEVTAALRGEALWKLFLFDIIDDDPFVQIDAKFGFTDTGEEGGKVITNLNQCSLSTSIILVKQMMEKVSSLPF